VSYRHPALFLFSWIALGFELRLGKCSYCLSHFEIGFLELFAQGWLPTMILLVSAS
jgi:hypothetical protein